MKKLLALMLMLCLLPVSALAEMDGDGDVVVTLDGAEFFFTPIVGYCLTRESSASVFNRAGMSQREVVPWMEENDVYALLYDEMMDTEIQIVASATSDSDYDDMNEYGETLTCESMRSFYEDQGYEVESVEIYRAEDGHKYVRTMAAYTYEDGYVEHMVEYFTCQAGYAVFVLIFPYEGAPTEEQLALGAGVVDSLWITETSAVQ